MGRVTSYLLLCILFTGRLSSSPPHTGTALNVVCAERGPMERDVLTDQWRSTARESGLVRSGLLLGLLRGYNFHSSTDNATFAQS